MINHCEGVSTIKEKNYYLNTNTGKLHKVGQCYHAKNIPVDATYFTTEDEAISSETRFMAYCKLCFKEK